MTRLGRTMRLVRWLVWAFVLGTGALAAQFTGPGLRLPQAGPSPLGAVDLLAARSPDMKIAPGDVVTLKIYGSTDFNPTVTVGSDGSIQLPLIGEVTVGGLTVTQAENLVAAKLVSARMYRHPSVTLQVTEYSNQFVTVEGEIKGMVIPVSGERRLLDVLAIAGGLPPTASHTITILRPGLEHPIVVDLGTDPARSAQSNLTILPRDTILVAKVGIVYMLGAFIRQGAIPLDQSSPLTLLQATSMTGGVGFQGRFEKLRIIRTEGAERRFVQVDIKRIQKGLDPDPILQADDIVVLPTNLLKAALKNGGIATIVGLSQVALYATR